MHGLAALLKTYSDQSLRHSEHKALRAGMYRPREYIRYRTCGESIACTFKFQYEASTLYLSEIIKATRDQTRIFREMSRSAYC